jgi:hypothetical protein
VEPNEREAVIAIGAPVLLGVLAVAGSMALGLGAAAFALGALAIIAAGVGSWRVSVLRAAEAATDIPAQTPAQIVAVRADRRRPTFDRETGLLAEWYFRQRFEEEIARAKRYGHALTALVVGVHDRAAIETARLAARAYLRQVDFAGDLSGTIAICLPDTPREGAQAVVDRMIELVPGIDVSAREYPADGETVSALLNEHAWHTTSDDESFEQEAV